MWEVVLRVLTSIGTATKCEDGSWVTLLLAILLSSWAKMVFIQ